jgi:hypothetical protein
MSQTPVEDYFNQVKLSAQQAESEFFSARKQQAVSQSK